MRIHRHSWQNVFITIVCLLLAACGGSGSSGGAGPPRQAAQPAQAPTAWSYARPPDTGDGWRVDDLAGVQIDVAQINRMMDAIGAGQFANIDGVSIARAGRLVLDEVIRTDFAANDAEAGNADLSLHRVYSVTKSFNATLVGIAVDQGIVSTSTPVVDFFPQYMPFENWDRRKARATVLDFLAMQHGLEWDELSQPYGDTRNSLTWALTNCADYINCLLDLPSVSDPGTTFAYSTHASLTLGAIVEDQSGLAYAEFADQYLFSPLSITDYVWVSPTSTGRTRAGSGLFLHSRDMTKLGQLYLDEGTWNGMQIVSPEWIGAAVTEHVNLPPTWSASGYGLQWWLYEFPSETGVLQAFSAVGYGGQYIIAIPQIELVVSFTASNYAAGDDISGPVTLLRDYILPAVD